jgi:hypothetical protein
VTGNQDRWTARKINKCAQHAGVLAELDVVVLIVTAIEACRRINDQQAEGTVLCGFAIDLCADFLFRQIYTKRHEDNVHGIMLEIHRFAQHDPARANVIRVFTSEEYDAPLLDFLSRKHQAFSDMGGHAHPDGCLAAPGRPGQ